MYLSTVSATVVKLDPERVIWASGMRKGMLWIRTASWYQGLSWGRAKQAMLKLICNNNNQLCYDELVGLHTMRYERALICTNHNHNLTYANFCDNDNGIKTFFYYGLVRHGRKTELMGTLPDMWCMGLCNSKLSQCWLQGICSRIWFTLLWMWWYFGKISLLVTFLLRPGAVNNRAM